MKHIIFNNYDILSDENKAQAMDTDKSCKYYKSATYATCAVCEVACKYTSCYGLESRCKYKDCKTNNTQKRN